MFLSGCVVRERIVCAVDDVMFAATYKPIEFHEEDWMRDLYAHDDVSTFTTKGLEYGF